MRGLVALVLLVGWAGQAAAQDHHLVQWKKSQQCAVLTQLPLFGGHWVELGIFPSRFEAERALQQSRRRGECPAATEVAAKPPPQRLPPVKPRHRPME